MSIENKINQVFKKSWSAFSNNFVALIIGTLVALLLMVFIVTIPPLMYGLNGMCVRVLKGKKVKVSDVFSGFQYFFRSWGIVLLAILGVAAGLVLLIIPGLLLMVMWQYVFAVSIMHNKGVIDSLKGSFDLSKKHFGFSIVFWLLITVIGSLGSVTHIGLLVTIPFTTLATCTAVQVLSTTKKKK